MQAVNGQTAAMSQRVLVRSSTRNWDLALLVGLSAFLLAASLVVLVAWSAVAGMTCGALSVLLLLAFPLAWWNRVRLRQWAQDTGDGFLLIDRRGERKVPDTDVLSMALDYKQNHSEGILRSVTRRFSVWLATDDAQPESITMTTTLAPGARDALDPLVQRLGERLFNLAKQDMQAGRTVLGQGWTLERNHLTVQLGRETLETPLEEVTACSWIGQKLCLWRQGANAVWARVPAAYANSYILFRLIGDHLDHRAPRKTPLAEGDLGRIIFERKSRKSYRVACAVLGILSLILAAVFAAVAIQETAGLWLGVMICLAVALVCGLSWLHLRKSVFRCHELGVFKSGLLGERTLRHTDVEAFTFAATRIYVHGAYSGTTVNMTFEPAPEAHASRISYTASLRHIDQELDELRDQVSRMIAARMGQRLAARQPVAWTKHMRFLPDGLEYRSSGFLGRKPAVLLPYTDIYSYQIQKGWFFLWPRGHKKPVIKESVSQRNFFPGFALLCSIVPLVSPE